MEQGKARANGPVSREASTTAMSSADPNKKSGRTFQCRDVLWETFEQMARELECSVDYLINEAMKQYARQRSYGGQRTPYPGVSRTGDSQPMGFERSSSLGVSASGPTAPVPPPGRPAAPLPPPGRIPPPPGARASMPMPMPPAQRGGLPAPPPARQAPAGGLPPVPRGGPGVPPATRSVPPPLPRGGSPLPTGPGTNGFPSPAPQASPLTLVYLGERYPVAKDRFVIGRGKQSSDLTLKDPNVSRQHAMIEFQNGVYFMVDMGSTNGVEYNGQRIARKQIGEGDVFRICDHDILFTYR
jgi:neural Wiskott-Aldrich syndrome protein